MKVSLSWLKKYIAVDMGIDDLSAALTMAGLEVDSVEKRFQHLEGVVAAKIITAEQHPNADRLRVCKVDVGEKEISIVCGAPNAAAGMIVPCALPGTKFPDGMVIKKGKLRGEVSEGMLCSGKELQLTTDKSGLMELNNSAVPGTPISEILEIDDYTIEIDLTPNRPDCLSIMGTAREAGAFQSNSSKITIPEIKLPAPSGKNGTIDQYTSVDIKAPDHCPRYAARLVFDVKIGPSPFWLQDKLESVGMKPLNNIVDITNFVMMETGQPLHAFDFDSLEENRIEVRTAENGEKFTTLDDTEHTLNNEMLMICDGKKPVAIAGVMGGLNSEIKDSTTRVLIESAWFDHISIRKTSKKTGLHTDAAHRFERGTDPEGVIYALNRAAQLMAELGEGDIVEGLIDNYPKPYTPVSIEMTSDAINNRLGTDLTADQMKDYFEKIEFHVEKKDNNTLVVSPPSFRVDIKRVEDLSEEIARLWGYNNIATTFPEIPAESNIDAKDNYSLKNLIRNTLSGLGMSEVINYSFINEAFADKLLLPENHKKRECVVIKNPISEEQSVMRTTMIPGLLETVQKNNARQIKTLKLFEVGTVFQKTSETSQPEEYGIIAGLITGRAQKTSWHSNEREFDFFDLKGILEDFFNGLHIKPGFGVLDRDQCHYTKPGYSATILCDEKPIGILGKIHQKALNNYDIKQDVYTFEIELESLLPLISYERSSSPVPKFPFVTRDTTIICKNGINTGLITKFIENSGEKLIEKCELLSIYTGENIQEGSKSVSLRTTYRADNKTLKDKAVNKIHSALTNKLINEFDANLP